MTAKELTSKIDPLFGQIMEIMREAEASGLQIAAILYAGAVNENNQIEMYSAGGGSAEVMANMLVSFGTVDYPSGKEVLIEALRGVCDAEVKAGKVPPMVFHRKDNLPS